MAVRVVVAVIILQAALAGCSGRGTPSGTAPSPSGTDPWASTTDEQGGIEGLVLQPDELPIGGATVRLLESAGAGLAVAERITAADGRYRFGPVGPGTYRVEARAEGFATSGRLVEVRAARVESANLFLEPVASPAPRSAQRQGDGLLACAVSFLLAPQSASCPGSADGFVTRFAIPDNVSFLIAEATWDSPQDAVALYFYDENSTDPENGTVLRDLADVWGEPALRLELEAGKRFTGGMDSPLAPRQLEKVPEKAFLLNVTGRYAGRMFDEANTAAGPGCALAYGRCSGVGATLSLRYTVFITMFFFDKPLNPSEHSALTDG